MTIEQLEQRVIDLEQQVAALQAQAKPLAPMKNVEATFGMFAADEGFDDVIEQGRQYREQANAEDWLS